MQTKKNKKFLHYTTSLHIVVLVSIVHFGIVYWY